MLTISKNSLIRAMVEKGIGVKKLSQTSTLSIMTLVKYMQRDSKCHIKTLRKLAKALNVSPFDLIVEKILGDWDENDFSRQRFLSA